MNLLDFYRNAQTEAAVQQWGDRLERMTIRDKLDALWTIATHIGHCEQAGEIKTLADTQNEYGCLVEEANDSESFLALLEQSKPTIEDLLAVMACLSSHLHSGIYKGES